MHRGKDGSGLPSSNPLISVNAEHIESYLAGELSEEEERRVENALANDAPLRERFLEQMQLDAALSCLLGEEEREITFEEAVIARLHNEGADEPRAFAKSVLTEIVRERGSRTPGHWPDLLKAAAISAAASIALMFVLQGIIFRAGDGASDVGSSGAAYVARLESSRDLELEESNGNEIREDGWLTPGRIDIRSGNALIAFNSGATIAVEGPSVLSIETPNRVFLHQGSLTADVPPPATGFTVNTRRVNVVDIGTRFGVSVDPGGDTELHVMEGAVEASRTIGNSAVQLIREGSALLADSRTRSELQPIPYAGDRFLLRLSSRPLSQPFLRYRFDGAGSGPIEDSGAPPLYDVPLVGPGQLESAPKRGAGLRGGGLAFQPGRYLEVPLSHNFRLDSPFTVSFWVKLVPSQSEGRKQTLLSLGNGNPGWTIACDSRAETGSSGVVRIDFGNGSVVGMTDIADGNWHSVTCRFLGADRGDLSLGRHLHLFVDGIQESVRGESGDTFPTGPAKSLRFGEPGPSGFAGSMDQFHLFNDAVSTTTIQKLSAE